MFKKTVALLITMTFFVSCAGMTLNPAELQGNHARGNWVNKTFLLAWTDYQKYAALPNLRPEAKDLLNAKRKILAEFIDPNYGPIIRFNGIVESGVLITDDAWVGIIDKLTGLDQGWYTTDSAYTVGSEKPVIWKLTPRAAKLKDEKELNQALVNTTAQAKLIDAENQAQISPIFMGALLELLKTCLHGAAALIQQRGMTEEQLAVAWTNSWAQVKALDANTLVVIK